jgi:hypothetical protein
MTSAGFQTVLAFFKLRRILEIAEIDRWDRSLNSPIKFRQFRQLWERDNSIESKKKFPHTSQS